MKARSLLLALSTLSLIAASAVSPAHAGDDKKPGWDSKAEKTKAEKPAKKEPKKAEPRKKDGWKAPKAEKPKPEKPKPEDTKTVKPEPEKKPGWKDPKAEKPKPEDTKTVKPEPEKKPGWGAAEPDKPEDTKTVKPEPEPKPGWGGQEDKPTDTKGLTDVKDDENAGKCSPTCTLTCDCSGNPIEAPKTPEEKKVVEKKRLAEFKVIAAAERAPVEKVIKIEVLRENRQERRKQSAKRLRRRWGRLLVDTDGKAELERHASCVARLQRVRAIAETKKDKQAVETVDVLLTKEDERHFKKMNSLREGALPEKR